MRGRWAALILLGLVGSAGALGLRPACAEGDRVQRLEAAVGEDFWGAVLVRQKGQVLMSRGYGKADLAKRDITDESLFDIGSVSKQFTAAAVLKLQMEGKLSVEDRLADHVKGVPEDKAEITILDLLTHMSGLAIEIEWGGEDLAERHRMVERVLSEPLRSEPGEEFAYSNVGYFVLAALIEVVSGESFESYLKKHLFRPAGMRSTGFVGDRSLKRSRATARVQGPRRSTALDYPWNWANRGATGVVTTTKDLARWDDALRGTGVLDEATQAVLFEPREGGYACGWKVGTSLQGTPKQHHGGTTGGYQAELARFPEEEALIVVLTNREHDGPAVAGRLEAALFGAEEEGPGEHAAGLGRYGLPGGGSFEIARDAEGLVLRGMGTEACSRVFYGLARLPDWPHLLDQMGQEGCAQFVRLAKGSPRDARELLPDPEAFLAGWRGLEARHGKYASSELIGSNSGRAMNTYVRAVFGAQVVVFRLDWGTGQHLARVEAIAKTHPYEIRLVPLAEEGAFAAQTQFGGRRVGLQLGAVRAGRAASLTWTDATEGPGGRIVCERLD